MTLTVLSGYVKLSTAAVEKSVDGLRVEEPSAGPADGFCDLVRKSPELNNPPVIMHL
jgi:hypothetical protein